MVLTIATDTLKVWEIQTIIFKQRKQYIKTFCFVLPGWILITGKPSPRLIEL